MLTGPCITALHSIQSSSMGPACIPGGGSLSRSLNWAWMALQHQTQLVAKVASWVWQPSCRCQALNAAACDYYCSHNKADPLHSCSHAHFGDSSVPAPPVSQESSMLGLSSQISTGALDAAKCAIQQVCHRYCTSPSALHASCLILNARASQGANICKAYQPRTAFE